MWRTGYLFNHGEIIGGGEFSFIDLIDAIREFGVNPIAFVPGPGEVSTRLKSIGVDTQTVQWPALRVRSLLQLPRRQKRLAQLFKKLQLDLVHTNGARCMLYAGPAARRAGLPCIWHVRVLDRDRMLDRIRSIYASAVVANSKAVAEKIHNVIGTTKRVNVIYNGFRFTAAEEIGPLDLQREFGLPEDPVILAVGRFTPWKKFEDLIAACEILQRQSIRFTLLLVGDALAQEKSYKQKLRALVTKLHLKNVFFAGWRNDVLAIMKSATALVLPSHGEPFGRVIVEAWAAGIPVIATNAGGPAELIHNGVDGLLVPVGDIDNLSAAMHKIIKDRKLAQSLVKAASKRVNEFSLQRHIENILQVYRQCLSST